MDNNKFQSQSGGGHVKEGHDETDLSIRGIVLFGVFLAIGGVISFVLMLGMIKWLEKDARESEAKMTPMEQQLQKEREAPKEAAGKEPELAEGEKPAPDWFGRGKMEDHLSRTIKTPRLQYDDEHDMGIFVGSEEDWLKKTGKAPDGSIHIPIDRAMELLAKQGLPQVSGRFQPPNVGASSAQYPNGAADTGGATGGVKK